MITAKYDENAVLRASTEELEGAITIAEKVRKRPRIAKDIKQ